MSNGRPKVGVGVYIMNKKNELLLGKRVNSHGDGLWAPPGGHLEFGEQVADCARRETFEETGIELKVCKVVDFFCNNIFLDEGVHYITLHVIAKTDDEPSLKEPDKCLEWQWFSLEKLPKNLFPPSIEFLKIAMNTGLLHYKVATKILPSGVQEVDL